VSEVCPHLAVVLRALHLRLRPQRGQPVAVKAEQRLLVGRRIENLLTVCRRSPAGNLSLGSSGLMARFTSLTL